MGSNPERTPWNEDRVGALRRLWDEGHATAEIGRRLRVSKNAIVGKAHRLDLPAGWTRSDAAGAPNSALILHCHRSRKRPRSDGRRRRRRDMRAGASKRNETRRGNSRGGTAARAAETTMGAVPPAQSWNRFVLLAIGEPGSEPSGSAMIGRSPESLDLEHAKLAYRPGPSRHGTGAGRRITRERRDVSHGSARAARRPR